MKSQSPTKLRKENDVLRRKLAAQVGALRNVRKREARLKGRFAISKSVGGFAPESPVDGSRLVTC